MAADNDTVIAIRQWFDDTVAPDLARLVASTTLLTLAVHALDTTVKVQNNRLTHVESDIKAACDILVVHTGELSQHSEALGRLMERDAAAVNTAVLRAQAQEARDVVRERAQEVRDSAQERETFWNRERIWSLFEKLVTLASVAGLLYAVLRGSNAF